MNRVTVMDYRAYQVEPPGSKRMNTEWIGLALLEGMPNLTASSEADLRKSIDRAHDGQET